MDIVDRIFLLVDKIYPEQRQFAEDLGIPAPRISEWRRRKSTSYNKRLSQIAAVLNTSVEYLLTGNERTPVGLSANGREEKFVQLFSQLTPDQQELVLAQLKGIVDAKDK
ncbi:hypothetical protein B5E56_01745 [Flavonifractor sp. An112]|uniref:helix-turn-helix domain-containing protein n=1 Tax=Flavonifractor sp. An112 TaxID=1965544 RepID=UPI000B39250D|nr:helix-turn-helix domain-containing protein [Flavonifractor sp. An112]OUQ61452.1 hypothetical protein B5E56_01745 [Flavonifractor sp. An112]